MIKIKGVSCNPFNAILKLLMFELPRNSDYVFPNENGKPFVNIQKGFYSAVRRARIGHLRFHDLGHQFGSQLIMSRVDLVTVKELLGHKDISATMRYAHFNVERKRRAVNPLP